MAWAKSRREDDRDPAQRDVDRRVDPSSRRRAQQAGTLCRARRLPTPRSAHAPGRCDAGAATRTVCTSRRSARRCCAWSSRRRAQARFAATSHHGAWSPTPRRAPSPRGRRSPTRHGADPGVEQHERGRPAASATGAVAACSQPRIRGFTSRSMSTVASMTGGGSRTVGLSITPPCGRAGASCSSAMGRPNLRFVTRTVKTSGGSDARYEQCTRPQGLKPATLSGPAGPAGARAGAAGSAVDAAVDGPGWTTVLRGAATKPKRVPTGPRPAAPRDASPLQTASTAASAEQTASTSTSAASARAGRGRRGSAARRKSACLAVEHDADVDELLAVDAGHAAQHDVLEAHLLDAAHAAASTGQPGPVAGDPGVQEVDVRRAQRVRRVGPGHRLEPLVGHRPSTSASRSPGHQRRQLGVGRRARPARYAASTWSEAS